MNDRENLISGGCLCGAVRFEIERRFDVYRYCFCSLCRRTRGTSHAANLLVAPDAFRWTAGERSVRRYDLPDARFGNCFCGTCGTPVPRLTLSGSAVIVPAGSLDEDPGRRPDHVVFWDSRVPWLPTPEQVRKFSRFASE